MSNHGFNLSTIKNSGNRVAEEGVDFITVTDGNGGTLKIMNIENEMYAPHEGIIEVVPLKFAKGINGAVRHRNEVMFRCVRDKATGWLIGIPLPGYKKDKTIEFEPFKLSTTEFLDLSIPKQRLKWICIKNGPFLKGSPNFQSQSKTVYEAVDRERQADQAKINRKSKRKALEIAESLVGEELIDMAIACGIDPKLFSSRMLEEEVIKFTENPEKINGKTGSERFLEIYNSDTRIELTAIRRALSVGILTESPNGGIAYNGVTLGFGETEAVGYLKSHQSTLVSIDTQARIKQNGSTQVFDSPKMPQVKDEKDAVIERMKKELEDAHLRLKAVSEQVIEKKAEEDLEEIDPRLNNVIKEAKRLGLKGHLIARFNPLEERIQKIQVEIDKKNATAKN